MASKKTIMRRWKSDISDHGCIACAQKNRNVRFAPTAIHHIRHINGVLIPRDDAFILPLCYPHHQDHGAGISIHDGLERWEMIYGREQDLMIKVYQRLSNKIPIIVHKKLEEFNIVI